MEGLVSYLHGVMRLGSFYREGYCHDNCREVSLDRTDCLFTRERSRKLGGRAAEANSARRRQDLVVRRWSWNRPCFGYDIS
jgi:hypothetical protein